MTEGRFRRAYLGIVGGHRALSPRLSTRLGRSSGVGVAEVVVGSPADQAGVRVQDVILDVDGRPLDSAGDLQRLMLNDVIGRAVVLRIVRGDQVLELDVIPIELND